MWLAAVALVSVWNLSLAEAPAFAREEPVVDESEAGTLRRILEIEVPDPLRRQDFVLRFVLVEPGDVDVWGRTLTIDRPFYVCETELTNIQAFALLSASDWEHHLIQRGVGHRARLATSGAEADALTHYDAREDAPWINASLGEAVQAAMEASRRTRRAIRLPTVAEWLLSYAAFGPEDVDEVWVPDAAAAPDALGLLPLMEDVPERKGDPDQPVRHLLGNAAELCIPSRAEVEAIHDRVRRLFGWDEKQAEPHLWNAFHPQAGIPMGGSVWSLRLASDRGVFDEERFRELAFWTGDHHPALQMNHAAAPDEVANVRFFTGVRFVLEP